MSFSSRRSVSPTTLILPTSPWRRASLSSNHGMGRQQPSKLHRRALAGFFVCLVLFLWATSSSYRARITSWRDIVQQASLQHTGEAGGPKLIRMSMLYGEKNEYYERALETQQKHSERWGHEMRVLKEDISVGSWSKPSYMLSTIIQELSKPRGERAEWIMWLDADSIILNPAIPPEIFLPPRELPDVHLVATQDPTGLNASVMFLRIHPWSVQFLTEATAYPLYHPDARLGLLADQESLRRTLLRPDGGWNGKGYRHSTLFIPRAWINTFEWNRGFEGNKGDFLVHFVGLKETDRWQHMADWLDIVDRQAAEWEASPEDTGLAANATLYWETVQAATQAVHVMETKVAGMPGATEGEVEERTKWANATRELQTVLWEHADDVELLWTTARDLVAGGLQL